MSVSSITPDTWIESESDVSIGGKSVRELVREFGGTPLYVYCEATVRNMCRAYRAAFESRYERVHVEYSSKAFPHPAIARIVHDEGLHLDVTSGGELALALAGRMPASRVNFHGNNKTVAELSEALDARIGRITVDSEQELERLNELAGARGMRQPVLLRLSPSVDPHTHLLTTTGVLDSKFGFSIETGAAERAVVRALALPHLSVVGVHFHLGSPLFETEPYEQAIEYTLAFVARMRDAHGFAMTEFSPGGGFAVPYVRDRVAPTAADYADVIVGALKRSCAKHGLPLPLLTVEPGRVLVARAGVAIYSVGGIKHVEGVRTFVSVDGGMGDNIRPPLYDAVYSVLSVSQPRAPATQKVAIVGKFCESGDYLARDVLVAPPRVGDLIAMPCAGAYQVAMSSNYNAFLRPAVVFVRDGEARVVLRRETYADLLSRCSD
jgi:diaminopimelate decarboxylase